MIGKFINNPCEDSLTASVFGHLLHLPFELFWKMLRKACYSAALPENPGEPISIETWPIWSARNTTNASYVEPDALLRFSSFDLIVEAKRWDHGMQCSHQWQRELVSYTNQYGEERKPVRMLAIGGIRGTQDETLTYRWEPDREEDELESTGAHEFICPVHMCLWGRLLTECQRMKREMGRIEYSTSQSCAHQRILSDLIELFALHSFQTGIWFEETLPHRPQLSRDIEPARLLFRSILNRTALS